VQIDPAETDPGPIVQRVLFLTGLDGAEGFNSSPDAVSA
jgi:hypothetical protein